MDDEDFIEFMNLMDFLIFFGILLILWIFSFPDLLDIMNSYWILEFIDFL